jgi:hypothetical protein
MIKKYATLWLFLFIMVTGTISAQSAKHTSDENESFSVYPNPATGGKVFLSSKSSELKEIEIFDILGKKVMQTTVTTNKEINISGLTPGIYIITVKEAEHIATRKLIIK